jgi:hypothetical protein
MLATSITSCSRGKQTFGETDLCRPSYFFECLSAVYSVAANTDRSTEPVAIDLDHSVKQLLDRSCSLLDPTLFVGRSEELRCLDDSCIGPAKVNRDDLFEEVGSWAEVL